MNLAHLHIVLNHIPSIGTVVGIVLFSLALYTKNDRLQKLSLQVLLLMALAVLPTYLSGNAAQSTLRGRPEVPQGLIEMHQNSAMITLGLVTVLGTLAWFGLWQFRRFSRPGSVNSATVLVFGLLTAAFILRTAAMGGEISHPEIRGPQPIAAETGWREQVALFANSESWVWPACETLHFIGMPLLFGVVLIVNLRMLGLMKSISYAALHRLLPLGALGFVMNVVSGMIFFMASPDMYILNSGFSLKIIFLILAGVNVIYFTVFEEPWNIGPEKTAPLRTKFIAGLTTVSVLGVMYFGRMLPFLRN
jgi:uncharacterized membrane protein